MRHILSLGSSSLVEPIVTLLRKRGLNVVEGSAKTGVVDAGLVAKADVVLVHVETKCESATALCAKIRASSGPGGQPPPIVVAADCYDAEVELAVLGAGVADYWAPPATLAALVARITLRSRVQPVNTRYRIGAIEVDERLQDAFVERTACGLTRREFTLLSTLAKQPAKVISRAELLQEWGFAQHGGSNLVDVHVARLRGKLGSGAVQVQTVRGRGFRLQPAVPGK